jgi:hypothetical protein
LAGTIGYGTGFVNSGRKGSRRLKTAGKSPNYQGDIILMRAACPSAPAAFNQKRQICALPEIYC